MPNAAALANPSDSGMIPANIASSSRLLRSTLHIKSVPILPGPMIATLSRPFMLINS
jgi:hypothetical protein